MAGCRVVWPNEEDLPSSNPHQTSSLELQQFIPEPGMQHTIYNSQTKGPGMERFTAGMRDQVVQTAFPAYFGTLISILSTEVGNFVQEVAQAVVHQGEIELLRRKNKTDRKEGQRRKKGRESVKHKQKGPMKVTHKQLWNDMVKPGENKHKIDKKPNHILVSLVTKT